MFVAFRTIASHSWHLRLFELVACSLSCLVAAIALCLNFNWRVGVEFGAPPPDTIAQRSARWRASYIRPYARIWGGQVPRGLARVFFGAPNLRLYIVLRFLLLLASASLWSWRLHLPRKRSRALQRAALAIRCLREFAEFIPLIYVLFIPEFNSLSSSPSWSRIPCWQPAIVFPLAGALVAASAFPVAVYGTVPRPRLFRCADCLLALPRRLPRRASSPEGRNLQKNSKELISCFQRLLGWSDPCFRTGREKSTGLC